MREFKFRVKDKETGEKYPQEQVRKLVLSQKGSVEWVQFWFNDTHPDLFIDNVIIEQYTGFKDDEGTELYEGDLVHGETRNDPRQSTFMGRIIWHEATAQFLVKSRRFTRGLNSFHALKKITNVTGNYE